VTSNHRLERSAIAGQAVGCALGIAREREYHSIAFPIIGAGRILTQQRPNKTLRDAAPALASSAGVPTLEEFGRRA